MNPRCDDAFQEIIMLIKYGIMNISQDDRECQRVLFPFKEIRHFTEKCNSHRHKTASGSPTLIYCYLLHMSWTCKCGTTFVSHTPFTSRRINGHRDNVVVWEFRWFDWSPSDFRRNVIHLWARFRLTKFNVHFVFELISKLWSYSVHLLQFSILN